MVYVGLGSETKNSTYISYNYVLLHGLHRSRARNRKININIYLLYLCFVSSASEQVPTESSSRYFHSYAMSPENPARLHGLRRSRVRNRKINIYLLYLCFVSSTSEQVPTDSSSRSYHIYAMSPENLARLHGLRRSRVGNKNPTYISYNYVLLHGLHRSSARNRKININIYLIYL